MIAVANPTREDGKPNPPPKWKRPLWVFSGARGAGKKVKAKELKALVWNARRKWARRVSWMLLVQICRKPGRVFDRRRMRACMGLGGVEYVPTLPSKYKESSSLERVRG